MATIEGVSLEADVARIRSILASNNVGVSIDNGALSTMLAAHLHDEERVDLVLLELEESFGIAITDPTQVQVWQEYSNTPRPFQANLTPEPQCHSPIQIDHNELEPIPNPNDVDTDIALDRETLLLRKEFPKLRYNEIYIFLRAHRDEPERLQLARNYFEQEGKRMEAEMGVSPPPSPVKSSPYVGASTSGAERDASARFNSTATWTVYPIKLEEKNLVGVAGPSRLATSIAPEDTHKGSACGFKQRDDDQKNLWEPEPLMSTMDDSDDVLLMGNDKEDNDPTLDWDLRELAQILPNVPEEKLRSSLWKYRQQGDRVSRVINDLLDSEVAPQVTTVSAPKPQMAQKTHAEDQIEMADSDSKAKRLKKNEQVSFIKQDEIQLSAEARTALRAANSVEKLPEKQGVVATPPKISNGTGPVAIKEEPVDTDMVPYHNVLASGKQPDGVRRSKETEPDEFPNPEAAKKEKSEDTNPDAKNSTRAPAKGKALAKPAKPLSPLVPVSTDTSFAPIDEEDEENATDAKIVRAKTLYRLITQKFPTIHVMYAAHQAAQLVELGWTEEKDTEDAVLGDIPKSGFPELKDEWFVPKPEPGDEKVAVVTSLRQNLLNKVIEEQVESAVQIFPNIDPEYLEEKISSFNGCERLVLEFIARIIENPKPHPSIEEYHKRQRSAELANKVWSAEDFLENYDNPLKYFYDPKRRANLSKEMAAKYEAQLVAYLRKEFPYVYEQHIQGTVTKYRSNAVLVYHALRNTALPMRKVKRSQADLRKAGNITCPRLIEEINFLRVENEIRAILKDKQEARKEALLIARQNNQFKECAVCCEDELIEMDFIGCPDQHMFCKTCVRKYAEGILGLVKCHFPCLNPSCDKEFQSQELKVVLKPQVFKQLMRRLQAEEVACANIDGLEMCTFCDYAAIPPEGDKIFQCLNPECSRQSCRLCHEEAHIPLSCQEFKTSKKLDRMRTYMEDKLTEALLRECPRCKKKFVKSDGCNKINCPCGAISCYICRKEVADYSHFDGQGSYTGKCPLWTNTEVMHQRELRAQAVRARQELEQQNPDVRVDQVLPEIPAPVAVPEIPAAPVGHPMPYRLVPFQPGHPGPGRMIRLVRRARAAHDMGRMRLVLNGNPVRRLVPVDRDPRPVRVARVNGGDRIAHARAVFNAFRLQQLGAERAARVLAWINRH